MKMLTFIIFLAASPSLLLAADSSAPKTKEDRQKMAQMHQSMADCLKSDKPLSECRTLMGKEDCPMMGGHGMKRRGMMGGDDKE